MFTPGPTEVHPAVLKAMSRELINPDIDVRFFEIYNSLCNKIRKIAGTGNDVFVMAGEGMLSLDAAVANLVEPGESVLAISSGVFGDGFADLVKSHRGKPVVVRSDYDDIVAPNEVDRELERNPEVKVVTFVHCDTPSGTISPCKEIGKVCNDHDAILITDAISTMGGTPVDSDRSHIDVCLGASQKCFSAPPGLSIISVSNRAWEKIERRKTNVDSFYLDLLNWKKLWLGEGTFPYTQSVSDVFALDKSLDLILKEGTEAVYHRHTKVANFLREACLQMGLDLFPKRLDICSDTVTALRVPDGIDDQKLRDKMRRKYGVVIGGSWGKLAGKVIRFGHMGFNAKMSKAKRAIDALSGSLAAAR